MKFVKYEKTWRGIRKDSKIKNATIVNCGGLIIATNVDLRKYKIVEANSFEDLDWTDTEVLNRNSSFGWLDREGNFYGCDFACHDFQAQFIHKTTRRELETLGWIHISATNPDYPDTIFAEYRADYLEGVIPTEKQLEYLVAHPKIKIDSVKKAVENGNYAKAKIYENNLKNKQKEKDDGMEL